MNVGYFASLTSGTSSASSFRLRPTLAQERGLALMEVIMASLVFGIAIVGVALMLSTARGFAVAQGDERVAFYLAQAQLEQLRVADFAAINLGSSTESLTAGAANAQTFTRLTVVDCVAKDDFTTAVVCPSPPVLKRITVTVASPMRQVDNAVLQTVLVSP